MKSNENLTEILANLGIESLNEMQVAAHHNIVAEKDVVVLSPTGSGKTLGVLLPVLDLLNPLEKGIQCLILTPSRELALQIESVWRKMSTGFKVNSCYGGHSSKVEIQNMKEPPALLIGTPGRIADHVRRQTINLGYTRILILDEYDKSLTLGFEEDMAFIADVIPRIKKRVLVSAVAKPRIPSFLGFRNPTMLDFTRTEEKSNDGLILKAVVSETEDKKDTLFQLLCSLGAEPSLIFCNLRDSTEQTCSYLRDKGIEADYFHGKLEQADREKILVKFRNGTTTFLVASDLASRGLDIPAVANVIHFELPLKSEDFIHRNGRTARMNASGTAYLILSKGEPKPEFLPQLPKQLVLPKKSSLPKLTKWITLYVSGGKKDKLSKMDIVGFLTKKGNLEKDDIGLIEVMDFMTFVAVKKDKVKSLIELIQYEKMKGKKYKIQIDK